MKNILKLSQQNISKAKQIIEELKIKQIWESLNCKCNLIGSVKTELLLEHLDIDFHTYSDVFSIEQSFKAISKISENPKIKEIYYKNLLNEEDMCLEWHLNYEETPERIWTIDIIHIKNESPYAGLIERVTDKINQIMTEEYRNAILNIKWQSYKAQKKISGIEIYQAVIDHNIADLEEFLSWQKTKRLPLISLWEPNI